MYTAKKKKSRSPYPLLILGAVVVFGFSLVNLVFPKRDQLELENRKAAQLPAFSVSALLDGSWQSRFARWMRESVALRDVWVNTQRAADEIVFQKVEEGGILLGKNTGCLRSSLPWTMPPRSSLLRTCRLSAILRRLIPVR